MLFLLSARVMSVLPRWGIPSGAAEHRWRPNSRYCTSIYPNSQRRGLPLSWTTCSASRSPSTISRHRPPVPRDYIKAVFPPRRSPRMHATAMHSPLRECIGANVQHLATRITRFSRFTMSVVALGRGASHGRASSRAGCWWMRLRQRPSRCCSCSSWTS